MKNETRNSELRDAIRDAMSTLEKLEEQLITARSFSLGKNCTLLHDAVYACGEILTDVNAVRKTVAINEEN